jgi:NAD(P)-dependent dehydrogenase (short-subunit alcohol dehydrogenase family)
MTQVLEGKTALVTGASRGIGRAVAARLADDGATIIAHYGNHAAAARELVDEVTAKGGRAFAVGAKLGEDGDVETLFRQVDDILGDRRLDILVNNAGILDATPFLDVTPALFDQTFSVNVRSAFFITQKATPRLADGGRIINVSSAVARIASSFFHYTMTKAAIEGMTLALAQALASRRITVNAVRPGVTNTDMGAWVHSAPGIEAAVVSTVALGRLGQPNDIAGAIAFLASDDAGWVTGVCLDVSGGTWLGPNVSG